MSSTFNQTGFCSSCLVGWVDQPNYRGTFDIILSCFLVLLTGTWTVLHINIPARNDSDITTYLRKARWATLAIFAPEVVTLFASCQWSYARSNIDDMHAAGVVNWTIVHSFYADSGGFMLHSPDMPPFPINTQAIHYLVIKGYLQPPTTTKESILDRSKADKFVKGVTVVQAAWMVAQCIGRAVQSLHVTPLELITVAFTTCTVASYFFWMQKPLGVEIATDLTTTTTIAEILQAAGDIAKLPYNDTPLDFVNDSNVQQRLGAWDRRKAFHSFGGLQMRPLQRIPDDYSPPPRKFRHAFLQWLLSMIHCAIHVAGWSYPFPTRLEQYLWRASSIGLIMILFIWGILTLATMRPGFDMSMTVLGIWQKSTTSKSRFRRWGLDIPAMFCTIIYVLARLVLLAQAAASLRSMPGSVYETVQWTNYIPHV